MGETTEISWADATFNPWAGCSKVSPACDHCYAEIETKRYGYAEWGPEAERRVTSDAYWLKPHVWNKAAEREGVRRRVFCGSWCDVMEERAGAEGKKLNAQRSRLWSLIQQTPWLDWLLTTKRPQNIRRLVPPDWLRVPEPNVWLITTIESDRYYWRWQALSSIKAVVKGISAEPLLGPLSLGQMTDDYDYPLPDWIICGGESQRGARPMHPAWARSLRNECVALDIPFHFKQWGEHDANMVQIGKKAAGHLLDGQEWRQIPMHPQPPARNRMTGNSRSAIPSA